MAKTVSGILKLTQAERKALAVIAHHTLVVISYEEGGTFNKEAKNREYPFDQAEAKRAKKGIEVIDFILEITK